jgi:hypothetical protein
MSRPPHVDDEDDDDSVETPSTGLSFSKLSSKAFWLARLATLLGLVRRLETSRGRVLSASVASQARRNRLFYFTSQEDFLIAQPLAVEVNVVVIDGSSLLSRFQAESMGGRRINLAGFLEIVNLAKHFESKFSMMVSRLRQSLIDRRRDVCGSFVLHKKSSEINERFPLLFYVDDCGIQDSFVLEKVDEYLRLFTSMVEGSVYVDLSLVFNDAYIDAIRDEWFIQ